MKSTLFGLLILLIFGLPAAAQEPFEGETLISPINSFESYLIDVDGTVTKTWHGDNTPGHVAYMLPDRSLIRPCVDPAGHFNAAGKGGRIQWISAADEVIWDYVISDATRQQHHDIELMPNGNVLMIVWELKTHEEALAAGRVALSGEMWPLLIVEVEPDGSTGGNIVWEWHLWDHLVQDVDPEKPNYGVVADHPELIDVNFGDVGDGDWIHANAIDYNPELDQIAFSSQKMKEVYIIDHSTTTEEAAGHTGGNSGRGGDILYRWGNPQTYNRGTSTDQHFFGVHGVNWIDPGLPGAGNLLLFNNGNRPGSVNDYSSAEEIVPPLDGYNYTIEAGQPFGPDGPVWVFQDPDWLYSGNLCGAYRMPNGNTLITEGASAYIFEVTESGAVVWDYTAPGLVHRAERYWYDAAHVPESLASAAKLRPSYPNPFGPETMIHFDLSHPAQVKLQVFDIEGRLVTTLADDNLPAGRHGVKWLGRDRMDQPVESGVYLYRLAAPGVLQTGRMVLAR